MSFDFATYPVLYVDDEASNLVALRYALGDTFTILTAGSGDEALRVLEEEDVAVLLTDQRMPHMTGVELCERAAEIRPDALRIIITAYADLHDAIDAINRGKVTRYLAKPFRNEELEEILRTAVTIVHVNRTMRHMEAQLLRGGASLGARVASHELAHEVNNHSTILRLNVQIIADALAALRRGRDDPPRMEAAIQTAEAAIQDCTAALEQLRGIVARARAGERLLGEAPARCDAAKVLDSTLRILRGSLADGAEVQLVTESSPYVPMEASALGQVLINLLMNASQAIGAAGVTDGRIVVRIARRGDLALLSVSDNGPGVPPDLAERVFDPFFTTKPKGDGLGLAIVRDLVEGAGGTIRAAPTRGGGATFNVELPVIGMSTIPPRL